MRGSRNFRQSDKKSSDSVVCLFVAFFLVLGLEVKWLIQRKISFSRFRRGSKFFQGGPTFSRGGGVLLLIPYRNPKNVIFQGGGVRTPCPPPSGSALGCDLFNFLVRKMMRSSLALVLVFLQLRCMFSVEPRNKIVS